MRENTCVPTVVESIDLARESFLFDREAIPIRQTIIECSSRQEMERFIAARDALPAHLQGFIVPYSIEEYARKGARVFVTADDRGGFSLIKGELASLFSLPGARYGDMLVQHAVENGAVMLSCFDTHGKLPTLYGRHGFKETLRAPWDDSLAPVNWSYERWGRPDYVEMSR